MNDALSPNLRLIGRYAVLRELRRDRSSVTYIGMDPVMHREVILKAVQLPAPATIPDSNESQIARWRQPSCARRRPRASCITPTS